MRTEGRHRRGGLALVYRGPAALDACAHSAAVMVRRARPDLQVRFIGPDGDVPWTRDALAAAVLYVQPGGGSLRRAWKHLRPHADDVRDFVTTGGAYLGLCLGGYLAGRTPGFSLFDGDTDRYAGSPGAPLRHTRDTVLPVSWLGRERPLFFQDGPRFVLDDPPGAGPVHILARYPGGAVAALVQPRGRGRVAVVGPHPEATADWYLDAGLTCPRDHADLGVDLLHALLDPVPASVDRAS